MSLEDGFEPTDWFACFSINFCFFQELKDWGSISGFWQHTLKCQKPTFLNILDWLPQHCLLCLPSVKNCDCSQTGTLSSTWN